MNAPTHQNIMQLSYKRKNYHPEAKALPLVTYMSTCLYVPKLIIDTIDKVLYNFVWKKKHHVKRATLIASPSQDAWL